jgi:arylsulfatase
MGGDTAGWTLYMRDGGKLVYHYNWFDMERYEIVSDRNVPTGQAGIRCEFVNESEVPGGPATVSLLIGNEPVGRGRIDKQVRGRFSLESLDIGVDALTPVDKAYADKQPYWFTGTINTVHFDFGASVELTPEEKFEQMLAMD